MSDYEGLYAVFDTVSTEQKTKALPYFEARTECERLGGSANGYIVCPINNPPKPKEAIENKPFIADKKEPGLFDF